MAKQIKTVSSKEVGIIIESTDYDGTKHREHFHIGDTITDFKYIANGDVIKVTGKLVDVVYKLDDKFKRGTTYRDNTFGDIYNVTSLTLDCSVEYHSDVRTVTVDNIISHNTNETNVKVTTVEPECTLTMAVKLSDETETTVASLHEGGELPGLTYSNSNGDEIEGNYTVENFIYKIAEGTVFEIDSIKLKDTSDDKAITIALSSIKKFTTNIDNGGDGEQNNGGGTVEAGAGEDEATGDGTSLDNLDGTF